MIDDNEFFEEKLPLVAPFHSGLEAQLAAFGVELKPGQLQRYREWAAANPRGGNCHGSINERKNKANRG